MPRILLVCTGYKSNLFSSIALAQELTSNGFDIVFAAPQDAAEWISPQGFEHLVIPHAQCSAFSGYARKFGYGFPTPAKWEARSDAAARGISEEGFVGVLEKANTDLVVSDCEHHSAILQTVAAGIPIALLAFMYFSPPGPASPPLTSAIVPGHGLRGSPAVIGLRWRAFHIKWNSKLFITLLKYWGADFASTYRALARRLNVPLDTISTRDAFQAPWSYRLPTLYLLPSALQLPVQMPEQHIFVGSKTLLNRSDAARTDAVDAFIADPKRRKIYVSFGTVRRAPKRIFAKLVQIAQKHPDWRFLIATPQADPLKKLNPPDTVAVEPWVPQMDVLQAADCAIFHGGAGTMLECVLTDTPMLVIPNGLDGKGNGARVAYHGLGLATQPKVTVAALELKIDALLSDPAYKTALDRQRDQNAHPADGAARFLQTVLGAGQNEHI